MHNNGIISNCLHNFRIISQLITQQWHHFTTLESFHNYLHNNGIISQLFTQQWHHFTTYDRHKFDKTFCELNDVPKEITVDEINSKSQNLVDLNEDYEEESEEDSDYAGGKSLVGITNSHDNDDVNCCIQLLNQIPNASEVTSNSPKKRIVRKCFKRH